MLGIIFKEREREKFEAANGNKGSSKKGDCRKCLVSDSWPGIESLGEPVAASGMLMRCLTLPSTWADFVTGENREQETGMQKCWQSWGKQRPEHWEAGEDPARILEKQPGRTTKNLVAQSILQPRHSRSSWHSAGHSRSMTSFGIKELCKG